mgnify:FL=1
MVAESQAAEKERRRLKRLQLQKEYAVPSGTDEESGAADESKAAEGEDSTPKDQSQESSESDLDPKAAAEARRKPSMRGKERGPPRGVTVMEIAAALNDDGRMLASLTEAAKVRAMEAEAAIVRSNEEATKIMQARREAYEKMKAEEAKREAAAEAEEARRKEKEDILKEKMRKRLERCVRARDMFCIVWLCMLFVVVCSLCDDVHILLQRKAQGSA